MGTCELRISIFSLILLWPIAAFGQSQSVVGDCNIVVGAIGGDFIVTGPLCNFVDRTDASIVLSEPLNLDTADIAPLLGRWCVTNGRMAEFNAQADVRPTADGFVRVVETSGMPQYLETYAGVVLDEPLPTFLQVRKDMLSGSFFLIGRKDQVAEIISLSNDGYRATFFSSAEHHSDGIGRAYHRCGKCFTESLILFCEPNAQFRRYYNVPGIFDVELPSLEMMPDEAEALCHTAVSKAVDKYTGLVNYICSDQDIRRVLSRDRRLSRMFLESFSFGIDDIVDVWAPHPTLLSFTETDVYDQRTLTVLTKAVALSTRISDHLLLLGEAELSNLVRLRGLYLRWLITIAIRDSGEILKFKSDREIMDHRQRSANIAGKALDIAIELAKSKPKDDPEAMMLSGIGFHIYGWGLFSSGDYKGAAEAFSIAADLLRNDTVSSSGMLPAGTAKQVFAMESQFERYR